LQEVFLEFETLVQEKTRISDQVRQILKDAILDGKLKPGEKIPTEEEITRQFGVSKVTVREALRGLESEGLIEIRRGASGGSFATSPASEKIGEMVLNYYRLGDVTPENLVEFRRILEPAIAELATERRTEAELEALKQNIEKVEKDLTEGRIDRPTTREFHYLLADACHNPLISHVMKGLAMAFGKILDKLPFVIEDARTDLDYSRQLYECLINQNSLKAREVMTAHFDTFQAFVQRTKKPEDER
jgi:GntR family transcriptional regulator, transcriptional repressor for pyruvate dehydrogenase complex